MFYLTPRQWLVCFVIVFQKGHTFCMDHVFGFSLPFGTKGAPFCASNIYVCRCSSFFLFLVVSLYRHRHKSSFVGGVFFFLHPPVFFFTLVWSSCRWFCPLVKIPFSPTSHFLRPFKFFFPLTSVYELPVCTVIPPPSQPVTIPTWSFFSSSDTPQNIPVEPPPL